MSDESFTLLHAAYDSKIEGNIIFAQAERSHKLDAEKLVVADADGPCLLRHRVDGNRLVAI